MLQQRLKSYSDKVIEGGRVNAEKLINFMQRYCFASGCIDPVVLDFSYRLALTQTRVARSYACLDDDVRQDALLRMWQAISQDIKLADPKVALPLFLSPEPGSTINRLVRFSRRPMIPADSYDLH